VPETGAIMKCLSSDFHGGGKLHGLNPSANIIDELWAHRNSDVYDALTSADAAWLQPITDNISTVGPRREGPLWDLYQRALAGDDKALFMVHFGAKPGMDPGDRRRGSTRAPGHGWRWTTWPASTGGSRWPCSSSCT